MAAVKLEGWDELQRALDRIDDRLVVKVKREALAAGARVVASEARRLCPEGDEDHNPGAIPLHETIDWRYKDYGQRGLVIIGPVYPAGAHGHNVENGHAEVLWGKPTGRRVPPKPFLRPAFDGTKEEQHATMERVVARNARELGIQ
jgi:hypothetical protein